MVRTAFVAVSAIALSGCVVPLARRPAVTEFEPLAERPTPAEPANLTEHNFGTSTIVFSDGRTTIMTDGFFSRPSIGRLLLLPVAPNEKRIRAALDRAGLGHAAAIFVAHSHHDHAMDTPYVAQLTGATVVGSRSTENIALGVGFPRDRVQRIADGSVCRFGAFTVTIFQTPHSTPKPFPGEISGPLSRSAWVEDYREGGNFTFHVAHPLGNVLVVPSRGVRKGWSGRPLRADTVFLGVGGLVSSADKLRPMWDQFVVGFKAETVYPIHWDDFLRKASSEFDGEIPSRLRKKLHSLEQLAGRKGMVKAPPYAVEIPLGHGQPGGTPPSEAVAEGCVPKAGY
jgi:L-ascorbate metabolism protein UlaG (beta-lactamase superfamily)